jgi:hypothetical protein
VDLLNGCPWSNLDSVHIPVDLWITQSTNLGGQAKEYLGVGMGEVAGRVFNRVD